MKWKEEVFLWADRIVCSKNLILYVKIWHVSVAAEARGGPVVTLQGRTLGL